MDLIYFYPFENGGPVTVAQQLFESLVKRRKELSFELKIFVPSHGSMKIPKQFDDIEKITTIKNLIKSLNDCVIHIPVSPLIMPNPKFFLHLCGILKSKKIILNYHGDIREEMQIEWRCNHSVNIFHIPTYILIPYILRNANKTVVNSYFMSNLIRSKYGVKNDIVIPNGIDDFWLEEDKITKVDLEGDPALLYHGRLAPVKGLHLMLKGFSEAIGNSSKARLYIVSNEHIENYFRDFKKLCSNLNIEKNVIFMRNIDKKVLKSYLSSVDMAIYPSLYEPFSLAILEAFSVVNGPVYFSKHAGVHDFVIRDDYNLNAFEPTVKNISEIIKDVIDKTYDEQVIMKQKEFAKQYTWDKVSDQYLKVYNDLF